jgi:hypothetical protein
MRVDGANEWAGDGLAGTLGGLREMECETMNDQEYLTEIDRLEDVIRCARERIEGVRAEQQMNRFEPSGPLTLLARRQAEKDAVLLYAIRHMGRGKALCVWSMTGEYSFGDIPTKGKDGVRKYGTTPEEAMGLEDVKP